MSRPILFNGEMVRAILDGQKTQTRRPMKPQPDPRKMRWTGKRWEMAIGGQCGHDVPAGSPFGDAGDLLWVRETWAAAEAYDKEMPRYIKATADQAYNFNLRLWYKSSNDWDRYEDSIRNSRGKTRPSIHMPKWASRITLKVKRVWIEQLQDITPDDCRAEGVPRDNHDAGVRYCFGSTWNSIYNTWEFNPWVWCCEFEVVT